MRSKIEIVTTNAGHHVRIVAKNGEPLATTEVYTREGAAEEAILSIAGALGADIWFGGDDWRNIDKNPHLSLNVVYVDERVL